MAGRYRVSIGLVDGAVYLQLPHLKPAQIADRNDRYAQFRALQCRLLEPKIPIPLKTGTVMLTPVLSIVLAQEYAESIRERSVIRQVCGDQDETFNNNLMTL